MPLSSSQVRVALYVCANADATLQNQRMRQNAQQEMLRNLRPDMTPQQQQQNQINMMRMQNGVNMAMKNPNNMAQRAMANNQAK